MNTKNENFVFRSFVRFCALITFFFVMPGFSFGQDSNCISFDNCENYSDSCLVIGNAFIENLNEKKFDDLAKLFSKNILFRGLTPSSLYTSNDPIKTASRIKGWFYVDDSEKYEVIDSKVDVFIDCLHIYFRIFETYQGTAYKIEQHLYCEISDGKIEKLSLVCSGPRKIME